MLSPDQPIDPNQLVFKCDWRLGFNVDAKRKAPIGYLLSWSGCGGLKLSADVEVWHPMGSGGDNLPGPTVQCVGIIDSLSFTGPNDPIDVSCLVSRESAANVRAKLSQPLTNSKVRCNWCVLDFDGDRKSWYEAAFVRDNQKVDANLDARDGELQMFVNRDSESIAPTLDIRVFGFKFSIVPAPGKAAELEFATGPTIKMVRSWGDN